MAPTADDLEWWDGRLEPYERPTPSASVRAPRSRAQSSGAGAFLALADDGRQYWVKVPGNPQGNQVLVNEVIVAELGLLLDAPIRERALIQVPPGVTEWSLYPGPTSTVPVVAHGSLHLVDAVDSDEILHTRRGTNARRQSAIYGLWDLCVGEDPQWLYETRAADAIWSYDHGLWFTTGEGDWTGEVLSRLIDVVAVLPGSPEYLDPSRLRAMADDLEALTAGDFLRVVSAVPVAWGADDHDLESMAWFLYRRRGPVANRLRQRADAPSVRPSTGRPR